MNLMQEIIANAQTNKQRIVLPEGDEPRTLKAADRLLADGVADIILIGPAEKIKEMTAEFGLQNIGKARIIDPMNNPDRQKYADLLFEPLNKPTTWLATLCISASCWLRLVRPTVSSVVPAAPRATCSVPPCKSSRRCLA